MTYLPVMRTKVFKSGNSKAVRLPAEIAYDLGAELEIARTGDVTTLRPASAARKAQEVFAQLDALPRPENPEIVERTVSRDTLDDL